MKLLPVTLTLFDKATNNTYKGTLLLKNLDNVGDSQNASLVEEDPNSEYDGKGAGLFIILVVSVYALSIVLFIASFITKKATAGETSDDNMVNTYLHKVGDLKEKTARDHFKKLKMSIISKVEMDSENQKRNRKGSKGAKDMQSMSRTSSKTSLADANKFLDRSRTSTEAIPSTGLLPKEDDATQPLLGQVVDTPTPPAQDLLSPNFEARPQVNQYSPSLRRATSARMLSVIREIPDNESGEPSPQVGRTISYHDVSYSTLSKAPSQFPHSKSDSDTTFVKKYISTEDIASARSEEGKEPRLEHVDSESRSSLFKPVKKQPTDQVDIGIYEENVGDDIYNSNERQLPQPVSDENRSANQLGPMQRPRPRYNNQPGKQPEDVWKQRPQKALLPPPMEKAGRKPKNLRVRIPVKREGSDIWVLRNETRNPQEQAAEEGWVRASRRTRSPNHPNHSAQAVLETYQHDPGQCHMRRDKSPRDKSPRDRSPRGRSVRDRSPRERSPRDISPRNWSPRDWTRDRSPRGARDPDDAFCYPHDARSLPLPFRSPSPRSPPRSPSDHMPQQARVLSAGSRSPSEAATGSNWRDKATLKVTLDRSPDDDPYGCANKAFEQSPRLVGVRQGEVRGERGRTPPRVNFADEGSSRLQVPHPRFPVTFNSPGLPRKTPERESVQISKV